MIPNTIAGDGYTCPHCGKYIIGNLAHDCVFYNQEWADAQSLRNYPWAYSELVVELKRIADALEKLVNTK